MMERQAPDNDGTHLSSNGIGAMVARMQEKNLQLASERALRDVQQAQLNQLQANLDETTSQLNTVRRQHLSTVRTRHGVELELYKIRQDQEERMEETRVLLLQAQETTKKTTALEVPWKRSIQDLYAAHEAQQTIYQRTLQKKIHARQAKSKRREQKRSFLQFKAKSLLQDEESMSNEMDALQKKVKQFDSREETEDEEVASIAMQIKATLSKRTSLRKVVEGAKEKYGKANEEMLKWESICMN